MLFVSHDIDEAVKMADRIAIFRAGALVQFAAPDEMLARPADDFVAGFVGSDRTLKRLRLIRVREVMAPAMAADADAGAPAVSPDDDLRRVATLFLRARRRGAPLRRRGRQRGRTRHARRGRRAPRP